MKFKKSLLFASIALIVSTTVHAQEPVLEEVVVTGIRGSLQRAMDIKRDESGVVDAISAEDIGKFADANLAESLQRITGVSIDRQSGEGSQITVRGLGPNFNLVMLNGRQMPTASSPEQESIGSATQSRAFNFNQIASDGVSGVSVYKTGRADLASGGMGATVDISTARPFDYDDTKIVISGSGIADTSVEDGRSVTPEFGGLFATQLADGTVGLLANFSYSERDFSESSSHTDGWLRDNDGSPEYAEYCRSTDCTGVPYIYRPVSNIGEIQHNERKRLNAGFVAQFRPIDSLDITLDYVLSRFENKQERFQTGLFGFIATDGSTSNVALSENNSLLHITRAAAAADAIWYKNQLDIENDSIGLNINWQANETVRLTFDAHSSKAESQPDGDLADVTYIAQGPLGNTFDLTYSGSGVDIAIDDSGAFRGDGDFGGGDPVSGVDGFQSPAGFSPLGSVLRNIAVENTIDQYQFAAEFTFDTIQITTGISQLDYEVETNATSTGFFFQGLGPCPTCPDYIDQPSSSGAPSAFKTINEGDIDGLVTNTFPTQNDDILAQFPPTFFGALEESLALFVSVNSDFDIGDRPARITAGLRWEDTDVTGSAFQTFPIALQITANTEGSVVFDPSATPEFFDVEESYSVFLPSIDMQVEFIDNHVARASYGRSIARPDLNGLRPTTSVSDYRPGNSTASSGNPGLTPYISDNFDLSYEWYYDEGSFLSAAFFFKQVDDYIVTDVESDVILDVNGNPLLDPQGRFVPVGPGLPAVTVTSQPGDPVANFDTTRLLNAEEREVKGLELNIQHMFGESGFGMQANLTVVDSDAEFNSSNIGDQAILIGLSDSANLVGFYETDRFSVRLAANWRDEFLFATSQLRATNEPVYTEEYLQWDFSSSYNINDSYSVSFEVLNIFGEDVRQRGRFDEQFLFENTQDARYTIGFRAEF
ncbi:MAG: TonB-dependent receptor [Alcanivorax sp.]|jgi:TonB-dependent receptor